MKPLHRLGMLNREGMKAFNEGRQADALFKLVQADQLAKSMKSPLHEAKVRNNIGLVYQGTGKAEKALASFRKAARFAVEGAGENNILHRVIIRNISKLEATMTGGVC